MTNNNMDLQQSHVQEVSKWPPLGGNTQLQTFLEIIGIIEITGWAADVFGRQLVPLPEQRLLNALLSLLREWD